MIRYKQDIKRLAKTYTIEKTSKDRYSIKRAGLTLCKNLKFQKSNETELQKWVNEWMNKYMDKETGLTKYNESNPHFHNPNLCNYIVLKYKEKYETKKQQKININENINLNLD